MKLKILYADQAIVVADKPPGMLSVPGRYENKSASAVSIIREKFPQSIIQPSVHRLDMDTSGLLLFALTKEAHRNLSIQFQKQQVKKKYVAILGGLLPPVLKETGRICLRFRLNPENRPMQIYDPINGKIGITDWKILSKDENSTRVLFSPKTGRTHQLRLHSVFPVNMVNGKNTGGLGCPIIGDRLYGDSNDLKHEQGERMLLHASEIEFTHPDSDKRLSFYSEPDF